MEKIRINAQERETKGKGAARSLRREGSIPAVIYRAGESSSLTLNYKEFVQYLKQSAGSRSIVNLAVAGNDAKLALIKTFQVHPVYGNILHVDFQEVALTEKVKLNVKVTIIGEAIGVKRDKGVFQQALRQIEIECLPNDIPGQFDLDVSDIETGQSMHVSDLVIPDGVTIITDPGEVLAQVIIPAVVEEPTEEEEGEEGEAAEGEEGEAAEGEAAAPAEEEKKEK